MGAAICMGSLERGDSCTWSGRKEPYLPSGGLLGSLWMQSSGEPLCDPLARLRLSRSEVCGRAVGRFYLWSPPICPVLHCTAERGKRQEEDAVEPQAGTGLRSEPLLGSTSSWHLPDSQKLLLADSAIYAFWPVHLDELRPFASVL